MSKLLFIPILFLFAACGGGGETFHQCAYENAPLFFGNEQDAYAWCEENSGGRLLGDLSD